ncbi:hypothetical protein IAT38_005160 [Cryptococcus sp. DSM 104549]
MPYPYPLRYAAAPALARVPGPPPPQYPYYNYSPFGGDLSGPSPIYIILVMGIVFFMAANAMPTLIPAADRVWHVAPFVLQWGFIIIIFALMVQMVGLLPGVPQIHITYVHMTIATLLFILMWNHIVSDIQPAPEEKKSSSSSSSKEKPKEEKKEEKKKEEKPPEEPSPWDDLRAHPSAFLTTRLNKMMPWPFPMGKAGRAGPELWWEKGTPSHVGHFNKPEGADPEAKKKAEEEEKKKKKEKEEKEKAKEKEKEKAKAEEAKKAKEKEAAAEKERAAKEAAAKAKAKEEEAKKAKELAKQKAEQARQKVVEDKQKQKLWRTKYLAMIIGISLLNKTLGFLLLLFFSLQMVSQELNDASAPPTEFSAAPERPSPSYSSSSASKPSSSSDAAEKEKLAKMQAAKEKEKAAEKGSSSSSAKPSSSSSSSSSKPSSNSSSEESSSKSSSSSSSSSKSKDAPVGSDAIRKAAGSTTVTNVDSEGGGFGVPYKVGFGMHYIHTPDALDKDKLDVPSLFIPSEGMSHPLMTTTYRQYAN